MNKAILIGNLGRDPEINNKNGMTIAKFSVATSEKWKDKNTGMMQERTEWHHITAFGRLAEICKNYLFKGRQVCIEGRIQTNSWKKDGITRYSTEIIASTMKMLGARVSEEFYDSSTASGIPEDTRSSHLESKEDKISF
ncbi:MAG: single-stranded DNA-binding protein [Desulfobacterales bacterium]|nr:single-stranded DNA-binding protein [Desulfobacterales bacterium]